MKSIFLVMAALALLCLCVAAQADQTAWQVATVHGVNQYTIGPDGTSLLFHQQPRNTEGWYWYNNNGSPPGTLATSGLQTPDGYRDGSRTFAMSDVAVGQKLKDIKLVFEYHNTLGGYCTMNFFMTDGLGHYGIFSPASGGIGAVSTEDILNGWTRMTLDLTRTSIPDAASCAVFEHNGLSDEYGVPFTSMTWANIKNLTIAGMYDFQRSPAMGWGRWGSQFSQVNTAGNPAIVNSYGLALIWGDTVGNVAYTNQQREIRNVAVTFGGTTYDGTFANAAVPEPSSLIALAGGLGSLLALRRRRA